MTRILGGGSGSYLISYLLSLIAAKIGTYVIVGQKSAHSDSPCIRHGSTWYLCSSSGALPSRIIRSSPSASTNTPLRKQNM